jgi:hypothetical protein
MRFVLVIDLSYEPHEIFLAHWRTVYSIISGTGFEIFTIVASNKNGSICKVVFGTLSPTRNCSRKTRSIVGDVAKTACAGLLGFPNLLFLYPPLVSALAS